MAAPRLFVEGDLALGAGLALGPESANYLVNVMRLAPGQEVRLFNGRDGEFAGALAQAGKRAALVEVGEKLRAQAGAPDLALFFAPVKRQGTDWIVEKATELGARALHPVITRRTIAETVRVDRLRLIAREAAEQTERLDLPEIAPAVALAKILDGWDGARPLLFADEAGDDAAAAWGGERGRAPPLLDTLAGLQDRTALALLIGPEGGFDGEERRLLRSLPFVRPVSLGPRILRAETAVTAGLAVIQAGWGDWRAPQPE